MMGGTRHQPAPLFRRTETWTCQGCGTRLNEAAEPTGPDATRPDQGDIAVCLDCGTVHVLHGDAWLRMTAAERAGLSFAEVRDIRMARARLVKRMRE
jgi:hypothetical protein